MIYQDVLVCEDVCTCRATPDNVCAETLVTGKHNQNEVEHRFLWVCWAALWNFNFSKVMAGSFYFLYIFSLAVKFFIDLFTCYTLTTKSSVTNKLLGFLREVAYLICWFGAIYLCKWVWPFQVQQFWKCWIYQSQLFMTVSVTHCFCNHI